MSAPHPPCIDDRAFCASSTTPQVPPGHGYSLLPKKRVFGDAFVHDLDHDHDHDHDPPSSKYRRLSATLYHHTATPEPTRHTPRLYLRQPAPKRTLNSIFMTAQAAEAMLSSGEDSGGARTIKLTRGLSAGSVARPSLKPAGRKSSENFHPLGTARNEKRSSHSAGQLLGSVGIIEFLQQDERPTFVIDLADHVTKHANGLSIVFANDAFKMQPSLLDSIGGKADDLTLIFATAVPYSDFRTWALSNTLNSTASGSASSPFPFAGFTWKYSTIRDRLRIFYGHAVPKAPSASSSKSRFGPQGVTGPTSASPTACAEAPSYFERDSGDRLGTPGKMTVLYESSSNERSESSLDSNTEGVRVSSIASNGDMGISDLLRGTLSPGSKQRTFPVRSIVADDSEGLMSTESTKLSDLGFFDWTRLPSISVLPPHVQFARSIDWGATSLGPMNSWSPDLRGMCNLIMASPHPAAMYWGPEHVAIYNETYIALAGKKHPDLMGARYADAWAEIWPAVEDVFASALSSAQATMKDDDCLMIQRNGFIEETYFSWSIIPLIGEEGSVVGLYNPAFEKTRRKIAERRMLTLREIGEKTASAREVSQFWALLIEGLEYNEYDAPMVLVYSLAEDCSDDGASVSSSTNGSSKQCFLEGALGIEIGHPAAPQKIDLKTGMDGFGATFRQAMRSDRPIVLSEEDGTLDITMLEGIQWRGWGDRSRTVVVCPIRPTTGDSTLGFLLMCTNPRRPYDEDYNLFVQLLGRQLATSIASVVLFEEEIRRGEEAAKLAAQDRIELSTQLAARTQEAAESELRFTRMAELVPVGIFIGDSSGQITYCNDAWYDISQHPRSEPIDSVWTSTVKEEDLPAASRAWNTMLEAKLPISLQFRFKHPWRDKNGNTGDTWVLASAYPERNPDGQLKSIFGSVTDISTQKFAEDLQKRRMEEAMELKRQQENFIDITSHEMRNPLSAILQCADEISATLSELRNSQGLSEAQAAVLESNIDAAQTVMLCAQHQKRIVDDVLTLSKLDSAMLLVTPVDVQPAAVMQRALKMFEGELQTADIVLDFQTDQSFRSMKIDWVRLDPSRLLQVLINLTTNAIKFTTTQEKRTITVHLAASTDGPSKTDRQNIMYIPTRNKGVDTTASPEWGTGEVVYIHFAVQDTGRGLTESEKNLLFQRFSQASPRTHVTYGGSGLGLFISRELVELQGGEIGVSSERGKGSTFAFYIKARRSSAPTMDSEDGPLGFAPVRRVSGKPLRAAGIRKDSGLIGAIPNLKQEASASASASADALKILVVEDNLVNQKVLAKQLRKVGCVVYLANHGGEAIDRVKESRFWKGREKDGIDINVILMDVEMPVMDGMTAARKIRELQVAGHLVRHIPVIAVTANAREEQIKTTLEAGIDDVMSKPFRISELLPKIRALMVQFKLTPDER